MFLTEHKLENVTLGHKGRLAQALRARVDEIGPDGMHMYVHNPFYVNWCKGHSKIAIYNRDFQSYLVLAKYVNMFGKIYHRLIGVPFCLTSPRELRTRQMEADCFLELKEVFKECWLTTGEIDFYGLRDKFTKITPSTRDYYNDVEERFIHTHKSKWRTKKQISLFNPDGCSILTPKDVPYILNLLDEWAKEKKYNIKPHLRFLKNFKDGHNLDDVVFYGYRHEGRLVFCEIFTKNLPDYWRGEFLFMSKKYLPKRILANVRAYVQYKYTEHMKSLGVKFYYVASSREANSSIEKHKQMYEKKFVQWNKCE